jgi:putative hydrolases of HD superfamily
MYRMAVITMIAPSSITSGLNMPRCTQMAIVHDMAEALVGDITPVDGISKQEKSRREQDTMDYFCTDLLGNVDGGEAGRYVRQLWQEYEDNETAEARFVHDIDKLELLLQMVEYEKSSDGSLDLGEFCYVASRIQSSDIRAWCDELLKERFDFWTGLEASKS